MQRISLKASEMFLLWSLSILAMPLIGTIQMPRGRLKLEEASDLGLSFLLTLPQLPLPVMLLRKGEMQNCPPGKEKEYMHPKGERIG